MHLHLVASLVSHSALCGKQVLKQAVAFASPPPSEISVADTSETADNIKVNWEVSLLQLCKLAGVPITINACVMRVSVHCIYRLRAW